jgi:hypothetical protein
VRIFKTKAFARFARRENLDDAALRRAVRDAERGLIDADLGGGVIKQRIGRPGKGKSGGFRTMVLYKNGTRAVFVHGFAKSDRANVREDERSALKALAAEMLAYDDKTIAKVVASGTLSEVRWDEREQNAKA